MQGRRSRPACNWGLMAKILASSLAAVFLLTLVPLSSRAQDSRSLAIEDALGTHSFLDHSPVVFSPNGEWLAYVASDNRQIQTEDDFAEIKTGAPSFAMGADIYALNLATRETRNLTSGKGGNWQPIWSPNGRYLAFLSNRDGSGQERLWIWSPVTNELRMASDLDVRGDEIEWTPDSRSVLVTVLPLGLSPDAYASEIFSSGKPQKPSEIRAPGSTVILYHSKGPSISGQASPESDPWDLNAYLRDLALIDLATGKIKTIIHGRRIARYLLSPDGSRVAYTTPQRFEKPGSQQSLFDITAVNLATNQEQALASNVELGFDGAQFNWSPNSDRLAFRKYGPAGGSDCYVVELKTGHPRNITTLQPLQNRSVDPSGKILWDKTGNYIYFIHDGALWQASVNKTKASEVARIASRLAVSWMISQSDNLLWTPDDKSTVVVAQDHARKHDAFYKVDLKSGQCTKLLEAGQCYTCVNANDPVAVSRNGRRVAYFSEDSQHASDLWISDSGFQSLQRLTHLNPQFDGYKMGVVRLIDWLSDDGEHLQGALLLPSDYVQGKRYPLLVWVYGGFLLSDWSNHFGVAGPGPLNMQLLATRGYAVLLPDAPQHLGTPMVDLARTVLPGVNRVIEMGIADPDRLGVFGHSYGGFSTLSLIVQTKRFKAALVADGYGDLVAHYGEMDTSGASFGSAIEEEGQGLIGGPPWQIPNRYIENSPIFHLDRIETPLLIVHGASDSTVAPFLGDEMFVGLRRLGKEVEYAKYEGEGHSPIYWSYANQVDFCNRMIDWFDLHLKIDTR
jgi:dipeptidyl aminopeptidase/acylaminoacyl peptidase